MEQSLEGSSSSVLSHSHSHVMTCGLIVLRFSIVCNMKCIVFILNVNYHLLGLQNVGVQRIRTGTGIYRELAPLAGQAAMGLLPVVALELSALCGDQG